LALGLPIKGSMCGLSQICKAYGGDRETSPASHQRSIPVRADADYASTRETLDLAKITYAQLLGQKLATPSRDVVLLLTGYYSGKRNNTIIEPQTHRWCRAHVR
jgi:hypothetical protein